ncbi:hypothetical protein BU17DRAFT_60100 [Hysterangium stoloniferum]|nr:hypothetical protein BU17DRAFT_60100 [Hysterangium stoloniferum]
MDKGRGHFLTSRIILSAQNRGPDPFRMGIPPSQPFPVSHRRYPYPRRSAGEAAEPMPSTVIPSFIPDATVRIPRTLPNPPCSNPHRKSPRKILDDETARRARVLRIYILKVLRQHAKHKSRSREPTVIFCFEVEEESRYSGFREVLYAWGKLREVGAYKMWSAVVILSSTRVMDKEEALEESSHPQDSGISETVATWHPPSSQYAHFQPSAYTIPYPFSPRPVPAPNSSCIAWLNSGPVQSPLPPNLQCRPVRSHSLPAVVRRHYLLPGRQLLWLIGHVEVPDSNNPSVQSKVAPASDSGPEPSVE